MDPIGLPGRVESIFFFLVVPSKGGTDDGAAGRAVARAIASSGSPTVATDRHTHRSDSVPILNSPASRSDSGWFVESLQHLVKANRVALPQIPHGTAAPDIRTWIELRCAARLADAREKVSRHTAGLPWATTSSSTARSSSRAPKTSGTNSTCSTGVRSAARGIGAEVHGRRQRDQAGDPPGSELRVVVDVAGGRGGDPPAPCENSTRLVLGAAAKSTASPVEGTQLQAQGGAVALLGACFGESGPEPPHLRMVESPKVWTRAQRWLWAVGECPPVHDRCTNPRTDEGRAVVRP